MVALGAILWVTGQSIGGVARASTIHPGPHAAGTADCTTPAPAHAAAQANPLAPVTAECADTTAAPAH